MKKIVILSLNVLFSATLMNAIERVFQLENHTTSDVDVILKLGSNKETVTLKKAVSEEKPTTKTIKKDTAIPTCLNEIKVSGIRGKLVGKESSIKDVKGCSSKRIMIIEENGNLAIKGLKESFAPELGKRKPGEDTTKTPTSTDTTGTDTTSTTDTSGDTTTPKEDLDIKQYS